MKKELSAGFKVWFWIILIVNLIFGLISFDILILAVAVGAYGLLKLKKWGFWLIVIVSAIGMIISILDSGGSPHLYILFPIVIYLSLKNKKHNYWNELD